jgi:membrane protein required for beta-lactamase induction
VSGVPLQNLTPEWIPGRIFLSYCGRDLIFAGGCLLVNTKARTAVTSLGLTTLLTVIWIYLPMLLAAPTDVVVLNFFFDTLCIAPGACLRCWSKGKSRRRLKRWRELPPKPAERPAA